MRVNLRIERIVIRGIPVAAGHRLSASLQTELGALIGRAGLSAKQSAHIPHMRTAPLSLGGGVANDSTLGRGIAKRVAAALRGGSAGTKEG